MTIYTNENHTPTAELELQVESIEEVIAPGVNFNHNETMEIELAAEELEAVIAPLPRAPVKYAPAIRQGCGTAA